MECFNGRHRVLLHARCRPESGRSKVDWWLLIEKGLYLRCVTQTTRNVLHARIDHAGLTNVQQIFLSQYRYEADASCLAFFAVFFLLVLWLHFMLEIMSEHCLWCKIPPVWCGLCNTFELISFFSITHIVGVPPLTALPSLIAQAHVRRPNSSACAFTRGH